MGILVFLIVIIIVLGIIYLSKQDFTTAKETVKNVSKVDESQLNDDLSSSLNIDYRELRRLLLIGDFKNANLETKQLFGHFISGKYEFLWGPARDNSIRISKIPRADLLTIDTLWVKYSQGRFGWSVQAEIFDNIFNELIDKITDENQVEMFDMTEKQIYDKALQEAWTTFTTKVGWKNSDNTGGYGIQGSFPDVFASAACVGSYNSMLSLFSRLKKIS